MGNEKGPLIAVDLDDVLSMTGESLVEWHNKNHGSEMTLEDCHYFHFWKNPYWGTPEDTVQKFNVYHGSDDFRNVKPMPHAAEGLAGLKELGFRLVVLTARSHEYEDVTHAWIREYFPGAHAFGFMDLAFVQGEAERSWRLLVDVFEEVVCTAMFAGGSPDELEESPSKENRWAGKSKAEVIRSIGAVLLIDDSLENASTCAAAGIHVLLFGDYPWSTRHSQTITPQDMMSREARIRSGDDRFWERDVVAELPPMIRRVGGWRDVVEWLKEEGKEIVDGGRQRSPLGDLEALGEGVRV